MYYRKIRITLAILFFTAITLLFVSGCEAWHHWFGWMAKLQLLPAILAGNVLVIILMALLTIIFGRVYCSVICPMGIFQDIVSHFAGLGKKRKMRFSWSPAKKVLRLTILGLFIILIVVGLASIAYIIAPYSAYGRIASNLFAPVVLFAKHLCGVPSNTPYIKGLGTFIVAVIMFIVIGFLAIKNGRTWCNTICPVGTVLGYLSKFSLFRPFIDTTKCVGCKVCAKKCKASCIDPENHQIDYTRCVACFNCLDNCHSKAIKYRLAYKKSDEQSAKGATMDAAKDSTKGAATDATSQSNNGEPQDNSRRKFLALGSLLAVWTITKAEEKLTDGGLAPITDKLPSKREIAPRPAGSLSFKHFTSHCTECQLCVQNCPNNVLVPSGELSTFMQPQMQFNKGWCRPECTACSQVCPGGAILKITPEEKSAIQIGHAVWIEANCIVTKEGKHCGACANKCPNGAISLVPFKKDGNRLAFPYIDTEKCLGCGACEYLCPANPYSGIRVEGNLIHKDI